MLTYQEEAIPWPTLRTALEDAGRSPLSFIGSFRSTDVPCDLWSVHLRLAIMFAASLCSWLGAAAIFL